MKHYLETTARRRREFFASTDAMLWVGLFVLVFIIPAALSAQTATPPPPPSACQGAQQMAQWWAWIGAGWGAGIMLGVLASNPVGLGLIGTSVVVLQVGAWLGGC